MKAEMFGEKAVFWLLNGLVVLGVLAFTGGIMYVSGVAILAWIPNLPSTGEYDLDVILFGGVATLLFQLLTKGWIVEIAFEQWNDNVALYRAATHRLRVLMARYS